MNAIAFRSLAAAFCLAAISFDDAAAAPAPGDGWIDLFDGKTTAGWTPRSEVVSFEAKGGELHLLSKANCWVTTAVEMADFIAEAEVLLPDDAAESGFNSGFAFRCTGAKGKPKGYQCEIDLDKPGGIYGIGLGGWLYPNKATNAEYAARAKGALKRGAWNQFRVVAEGPRLRTYLNGALIADIEDARAARGYFGIQHHGKGGVVKFRKIRARAIAPAQAEAGAGQRPNILWITAEDMSPTLGCYGDAYAITPHLDAFARQSVRYDNAFAAAPVCSPSRSCLITGMYPASLGTHQMRSEFPLPSGVRGFPAYLREAGYFTANNVKTDYNCADAARLVAESWDVSSAQAHWRKAARGPDQPFFAVFNDMVSHQSRTMTWPYAAFREHVQRGLKPGEIHDPAAAPVPPYYPDTPSVRRTIARYYDCVTAMDQNVGSLLAELEEDGLAEDTIVFFYSDHGSGMPRHKRLPHDSGMRVALLVRFPEKWRHLAPAAPGGATDQLVSFADFAPTVLRLAGVEPPPSMQGKPFLGGGEARRFAYGSRDRVDEAFEFSRSVRDGRWLYIRNYLPHLSWNQPTVFSDLSEIRPAITEFAAAHPADLTAAQRGYAGASKPPEEFYDCAADPHNVENLAGQNLGAEQRAALDRLRAEFAERRLAIRDAGPIPEGEMRAWVEAEGAPLGDILAGKTNHRPDLAAIWAAADRVGTAPAAECLPDLASDEPAIRFWAVVALRHAAFADPAVHDKVAPHLEDASPDVRIEAAAWLAHFAAYRERALAALVADLGHGDWAVALRACRATELLGAEARAALPAMRQLYDRTRDGQGDANLFLAFSAGAFLAKLGEPTKPWDFTPAGTSSPAPPEPQAK